MPALRGIVVRCGLFFMPLGIVVLLCCVMMLRTVGGKPDAQAMAKLPMASVQHALMPSAEAAQPHASMPQLAGFERLNIVHARIRVPGD